MVKMLSKQPFKTPYNPGANELKSIAQEFGMTIEEVKSCIRAYVSLQSPEVQQICKRYVG